MEALNTTKQEQSSRKLAGTDKPAEAPTSEQEDPVPMEEKPQVSSYAILSILIGISSVFFLFPGEYYGLSYAAPFVGALALLLAVVARSRINAMPFRRAGLKLAAAGALSGGIVIGASLVWFVVKSLEMVARV